MNFEPRSFAPSSSFSSSSLSSSSAASTFSSERPSYYTLGPTLEESSDSRDLLLGLPVTAEWVLTSMQSAITTLGRFTATRTSTSESCFKELYTNDDSELN
jgi:hypothetical protein